MREESKCHCQRDRGCKRALYQLGSYCKTVRFARIKIYPSWWLVRGFFFFYICFSLTIAPKLGVFNNKPIQGSVHELELDGLI